MQDLNIALLIDADNLAAKYVESILNELTKYGKVTIRRMYGDWSKTTLRPWLYQSSKYSLTPVMQENNTKGKNASDICLVIDAMDILYEKKAECFCIASSDSDFNKLARRLRESGNMVIGMGERKTPESFRASCERFIYLDVLDEEDEEEKEETAVKEDKTTKAKEDKKKNAVTFTTKETIENAVKKMVADNTIDGKETNLGEVGNRLVKMFPDFDVRNYGYSKLSAFMEDFNSFTIVTQNKRAMISAKVSSVEEVTEQIQKIYKEQKVNKMNVGELKNQLSSVLPNIDASIKKSGVTKFSSFLERKVDCIRMENRNTVAVLVKKKK